MSHFVFISHNSEDHNIANAICHYLEEAGVRCWIAPRDVARQDWAEAIMDGIHKSDVFVVVVSKNSIASPEVIKEVTEATRSCEYILPFKIDKEMLSDKMQYHLGPCHWMDAVTPPMEKHILELKDRILNLDFEDIVYLNQSRYKLVNNRILPRTFFMGRENEVEEIHEMLQADHVLFLQGMGGIGKSEIAKGYAKEYANSYDTIIFANYQNSILDMVIGDDIQVENLKRNIGFAKDAEEPEEFYKRKMQVLKGLFNERTLLIVDNFDVDEDERLDDLINSSCKIIFTTRNEHYDYQTMQITKISDFDKVRQLFAKNYGRPIPAKDMPFIDEILKLVDCHTITIELIAKQMKASFVTASKMFNLLKESGTKTNLKEKVKREGTGGAKTSFDFIKDLFQLSNLSDDEKTILMHMCMVPNIGIDVPWLGEILELEDLDVINQLLSKSWLILDEESGCIKMHPIIRDVVKEELHPDNESCAKYLVGLQRNYGDAWQMEVQERIEKWPYVDFILKNYSQPNKLVWRQYASFLNIAWITGCFEQAKETGRFLYDFVLNEFGPNTEEAAFVARIVAGSYYNSGDNVTAEYYYKEAATHHENSEGEKDLVGIGTLYSKLGRCAYLKCDYEKANQYLESALEYLEEAARNGKACINQIGDTYVEYERMYMQLDKYEKALEYCDKSYNMFYSWQNREHTNCVYSLVDKGICYSRLKEFKKAEEFLDRALEINLRISGEMSIQTIRTKEAIADNRLAMGKSEEARQLYMQMEMDAEKNFGSENALVIRLREKGSRLTIS